MPDLDPVARTAPKLSRNPLGVIALFIVLVYGFASLFLGVAATQLADWERAALVLFLVLFPVAVLSAFYRLVTRHHAKLYAPFEFPAELASRVFAGASIPVPSDDEPITLKHIALASTCWRSPEHDVKYGTATYRFDVIVVAADRVLDRIERVEYHLPPAWDQFGAKRANQVTGDRRDRFRLKDITFGSDLIVHADVYLKSGGDPVRLSTFVKVAETGPRL